LLIAMRNLTWLFIYLFILHFRNFIRCWFRLYYVLRIHDNSRVAI